MNAQNTEKKPVVKRETKNRIRVDFDRSPLKDRLKARFLNFYFLSRIVIWIFRLVLMVGISYIVLYPFFTKIAGSVMAPEDFVDVTVRLIPKHFTLDIYRAIASELGYWTAFRNTFILSLLSAIIQTMICALIGYGFAKFKFKGRNIIFLLVILTMIIPHQTLRLSMYMEFRFFDVLGIVRLFKGGGIQFFGHNIKNLGAIAEQIDETTGEVIKEAKPGWFAGFFEKLDILKFTNPETGEKDNTLRLFKYYIERRGRLVPKYRMQFEFSEAGVNLTNTYIPMVLLSLGGLGFKNGLYIFLFRQFFRGIPDELEESAYIDGSGTFRTFVRIILPNSIPMLITVFLFSFCWQWTDEFYTNLFFPSDTVNMLVKLVGKIPNSLKTDYAGQELYYSAIRNTCGLMIIFPLVIIYAFLQRFLVQGIEQSGLAN